jgi:DNA-binding transcriptional LysR family regulator
MEWDDVRVLLTLLRARNLNEAGDRLGVDRSTISRRLTALEKNLGVRLFVRTREGLRPTAAVERLRPHAERMEVEAAALAHAAVATDEVTGLVRVATTEALGAFLVSEGLLRVRDPHPDLVIEILGGNRPVDLARGEADLAVRVAPLRESSLRARRIALLGVGLFASPAYLHARGAIRDAAGLRGHDVLLPSGELAQMPEARWLEARPGVRVVFRASSMPALVAAAVAGHGLAPLTLPWGDREPGLARVLVLDEIPERPVWLVSHAEAAARPAVKVVGDRIASIFARAVRPE